MKSDENHKRSLPFPVDPEGTMTDALDQAGKDWRTIATSGGNISDADACILIAHLCAILTAWDACMEQAMRAPFSLNVPTDPRSNGWPDDDDEGNDHDNGRTAVDA